MTRKALIICDMLNDFVQPGAPLEVPGARSIIPAIQREIETARNENIPIIYINDSHHEDDPEMNVWPLHAIKNTPGAEVVEELAPSDIDIIVEKTRYDGFYETDLDARLQSLTIEELILTGVCTEICIHYTGSSAIVRGYQVQVPDDCVAGLNEDNVRSAMNMLKVVLQPKKN
jgi:nicotinamidase/pyrazinamidase